MGYLITTLLFFALHLQAGNQRTWQYSNHGNSATITGYTGYDQAVTVPNEINGLSIKKIQKFAFPNPQNITSITISKEVEEIESDVFIDCINLKKIEVDPLNKNFFSSDGVLYDKSCKTLLAFPSGNTEVFIQTAVEKIGKFAFFSSKVKQVTLPDNIVHLNEGAFQNCKELIQITLSKALTKIEPYSFFGCQNLKEITLPASLEEIGGSAFYGCQNLKEVRIIKAPALIENLAFTGCSQELKAIIYEPLNGKFRNSDWLVLLEILNSRGVEENAFRDCMKLKKAVLHEGIEKIQYGAFRDCVELEEVVLPSSLLSIGPYAFSGCKKLTKINIPKSCADIDPTAFEGSDNVPPSLIYKSQ